MVPGTFATISSATLPSNSTISPITNMFNMSFYLTYLPGWPDYLHVARPENGNPNFITDRLLKKFGGTLFLFHHFYLLEEDYVEDRWRFLWTFLELANTAANLWLTSSLTLANSRRLRLEGKNPSNLIAALFGFWTPLTSFKSEPTSLCERWCQTALCLSDPSLRWKLYEEIGDQMNWSQKREEKQKPKSNRALNLTLIPTRNLRATSSHYCLICFIVNNQWLFIEYNQRC